MLQVPTLQLTSMISNGWPLTRQFSGDSHKLNSVGPRASDGTTLALVRRSAGRKKDVGGRGGGRLIFLLQVPVPST